MASKILFISGSIGLGHVTRDLAIVNEFRRIKPDAEILWLSGEPATTMLKSVGEKLLPEAGIYNRDTETATLASSGFNLNLANHLRRSGKIWKEAYQQFKKIVEREKPDLVVGDEAYELAVAYANGQYNNMPKTILIFDFIKSYSMSYSPMEMAVIWMVNRYWHKVAHLPESKMLSLAFVGEPEDVPKERLGLFLANTEEITKKMTFLGEIIRFDPNDYLDKKILRAKLGYADDFLVIASTGGTTIGRSLLDLCLKTYPLLKENIPNLHMILVAGPLLDSKSIDIPEGVELKGFIPDLYEHFAASDLSIVQAGGTTIVELIALGTSFLYFPLEGHFEQQMYVTRKAQRHDAGIRMDYSRTSPESMADEIIKTLGSTKCYKPIQIGGEKKMAELMSSSLKNNNMRF